jgi:hypothetical protein
MASSCIGADAGGQQQPHDTSGDEKQDHTAEHDGAAVSTETREDAGAGSGWLRTSHHRRARPCASTGS